MGSSLPGMVKKFLGDFPLKSIHDDLVSIYDTLDFFLLSSSLFSSYLFMPLYGYAALLIINQTILK